MSVESHARVVCSVSNSHDSDLPRRITEPVRNRTRLRFRDLSKFKNTLLNHLDAGVIERLGLKPVVFEVRHEIEFPGRPIEHLFFVEEGWLP
jgi:hypothetical protein